MFSNYRTRCFRFFVIVNTIFAQCFCLSFRSVQIQTIHRLPKKWPLSFFVLFLISVGTIGCSFFRLLFGFLCVHEYFEDFAVRRTTRCTAHCLQLSQLRFCQNNSVLHLISDLSHFLAIMELRVLFLNFLHLKLSESL